MIITILKHVNNAWKFLENSFRIKRLKNRGAKIGNNVIISRGVRIDNPQFLKIGDNVYIGTNFYANCLGGLTICHGTIISNNCTIMTWNHDYKNNYIRPYGLDDLLKPVKIYEQAWIGINVSICPGVKIGKQAIIGMGTTVSKNVNEGEIYAGYRVVSTREVTDDAMELLVLRTVFSPLNYLIFCIKLKKLKKRESFSFSDARTLYSKPDLLCLLYRYSIDHGYNFDLASNCLTRKEK